MASSEPDEEQSSWRKAVDMTVAATCQTVGFTTASPAVLETLSEAYISYLKELARSTKSYSDLACRCEPTLGDITMALVEMGSKVSSLADFVRKHPRVSLSAPASTHPIKQPPSLQIGERRTHPSHIPDYLPVFPDSHAFVQTPTHKQPVTNYEAVREKAAVQKRDMERSLTRFVARTGTVDQLFDSDPQAQFPLIACRPIAQPYLSALDPRDQVFDEDEIQQKWTADNANEVPNTDTMDNPFLQPTKVPKKHKSAV